MKAAIYNPYWDTLGGGERYTISFANVLSDLGYSVDLEWKDNNILNKIEERFGIKTHNLNVADNIKKGDGYDLCFWVSDGSIPLLHGRINFLHFQVPFREVNGKSLLNRMKMFRINKIICNSNFTKQIIDREYGLQSVVIYPPCDTLKIKPKRKENIILCVGRYSQLLQSKRQDVLLDVFTRMYKNGWKDWKLIFTGGIDVGGYDYINKLRKQSKGYPVEILNNTSYKDLVELYGKSRIFWSASGFGVNENKNPEKVEHFGITIVEAMAGGCVPVIYNAGGHKEIVTDNNIGYLWNKPSELVRITKDLVSDSRHMKVLSKGDTQRSKNFSYEIFAEGIKKNLQ
jgi:glycosyltransferase involved in cell wall biosynthesis